MTDGYSGRSPECEVMATARIVGSGGEGGGASDANRFQRRSRSVGIRVLEEEGEGRTQLPVAHLRPRRRISCAL